MGLTIHPIVLSRLAMVNVHIARTLDEAIYGIRVEFPT